MSHVILPLHCVFCNAHAEDMTHVFSRCPIIRDVFQDISRNFNLPDQEVMNENASFLDFLDHLKQKCSMEELELIVIA